MSALRSGFWLWLTAGALFVVAIGRGRLSVVVIGRGRHRRALMDAEALRSSPSDAGDIVASFVVGLSVVACLGRAWASPSALLPRASLLSVHLSRPRPLLPPSLCARALLPRPRLLLSPASRARSSYQRPSLPPQPKIYIY